jgi:hypothetical protein
MEAMREAWTDRRLDRLEQRVEFGFEQVNERFDEVGRRFDEMGERFGRLEDRFDAYTRAMMQTSVVLICALIGFIATTQL